MPKSETSNSNGGPSFKGPRYQPNWIAAVICFVLGPCLTVALVDYDPNQVTLNSTHATGTNIVGTLGANTAWCMLYIAGISTVLVPLFLFWILYVSVRNARRLTGGRFLAMLVSILALSGLAAVVEFHTNAWFPNGLGGLIGVVIYHRALSDTIGLFGSGLLLATIYLCSLVFIFTKDVSGELERYLAAFHAWRDSRAKLKAERAAARQKERSERAKARSGVAVAAADLPPPPTPLAKPRVV